MCPFLYPCSFSTHHGSLFLAGHITTISEYHKDTSSCFLVLISNTFRPLITLYQVVPTSPATFQRRAGDANEPCHAYILRYLRPKYLKCFTSAFVSCTSASTSSQSRSDPVILTFTHEIRNTKGFALVFGHHTIEQQNRILTILFSLTPDVESYR